MNASCPTEEELEDFLACGGTAERFAATRRHVESCSTCQAWLAEARADEELLTDLERVMTRLGAEAPERETAASGIRIREGIDVASESDPGWPRLPRYRILRRVGEGGMGVVYEAEQRSPRRRVALKVIKPEAMSPAARRRFEFEVEALARLEHPGIAAIFEADHFEAADGPRPFYSMQFVDGRPLTHHARERSLTIDERLRLVIAVCDAVQHAHDAGVIHRDLKPGNILVTDRGQPKVLDFGIALPADDDDRQPHRQTRLGQLVGTLAYMSPERVSGDPTDVDARSDVYALGVILFELLTGKLPHDLTGKSLAAAARTIAEEPVVLEPAPGIARELATIVLRALEKEKDRRLESARALGDELRGYLEKDRGDAPETFVDSGRRAPAFIVGRETELRRLQDALAESRAGRRQVVFVTGEAGIGKTTLVEAFLATLSARNVRTVHGQCVEHFGTGEAYLPIMEALGRLSRAAGGAEFVERLRRHAPTWLVQMPWLLDGPQREELRRELFGATRERMLREIAELLEAETASRPLVLLLEDLHWSDLATLDFVSVLARRSEPARLLVVATFRPLEVIVAGHPLQRMAQDLRIHGHCVELPLAALSAGEIETYVASRFPGSAFPPALTSLVRRRTGGHPLFLNSLLDAFEERGVIVEADDGWRLDGPLADAERAVPESLRQMIEQQVSQLSDDDRRLLEAASVAGVDFCIAELAAALEEDAGEVEERCEAFARRDQFLHFSDLEEWPDGTVSGRYEFSHSLFQNVLYERVAPAQRLRFHRRVGERKEAGYRERGGEVAAELALHFERGRDSSRAVKYLLQAAAGSIRRYANPEAIDWLERALSMVDRLPEDTRAAQRMSILERLGLVSRAMGDLDGAATYWAAWVEVAVGSSLLDDEVRALFYLASATSWNDRERCLSAIDRAVERSRELEGALVRAEATSWSSYWSLLWRGWSDDDAHEIAGSVEVLRRCGTAFHLAPHVARLAYFQSLRAEYREACRTCAEGRRLALRCGDAFDYLLCHYYEAWSLLHVGEWGRLLEVIDDALQMAEKNGHHHWKVFFRLLTAWLHEQAFSFGHARDLCTEALRESERASLAFGQVVGSVLLGTAHVGLGEYERAREALCGIEERLERERLLMDWIWKIMLCQGLGELWLARGDSARALEAAKRFGEFAGKTRELSYQALAREQLARATMARREWQRAERELAEAFALLGRVESPVAEWRVCATAAALARARDDERMADEYRIRAVSVLRRLAGALEDAPELAEGLLRRADAI